MDIEEFEAAGLYDPDDPNADQKLELLRFLESLGIALDEMVGDRDTLPRLAYSHLLRPAGERYTLTTAAGMLGVDPGFVLGVWRAAGFPDPGDEAIFGEDDFELVRMFLASSAVLGDDVVLEFVRVMSAATARVADAIISTYLVRIGGPAYREDPVGLKLARMNAASMQLLPVMGRSMGMLLRRQLDQFSRPLEAVIQAAEIHHDAQELAVVFVDLVDSTLLTRALDYPELAEALAAFEHRATDLVTAGGGRLVKLIGDEVMFVVTGAAAACNIALALIDEFAHDAVLPPVRAGVAFGSVLSREGDFFGPTVNLAARVTRHAAASVLLVPDDVVPLLGADAGLLAEPVGVVELKGFPEPVGLVRISRPAP